MVGWHYLQGMASYRNICFRYVICPMFQFHPGNNVGLGKDHTIFSLIDGLVKFEKFGPDKKKVGLEHRQNTALFFLG